MRFFTTAFALIMLATLGKAQPSITTFPYFYDWTNPASFVLQPDGDTYLGGGDGLWGSYDAGGVPGFVVDPAGFARTNRTNQMDLLFVYVDATGKPFTGTEYFGFQASRASASPVTGTLQVYANFTSIRTYNVASDLSTTMQSFVVTLPASVGNTRFGVGIVVNSNVVVRVDNTRFGGGALPITLSSFTLSMEANSAKLRWMTLTEIENYGFYVQKSQDNSNWTDVPESFQSGFGSTTESHLYAFTDNSQPLGRYYRLRQVDLDGTNHFSEVLSMTTAIEPQPVVKEFALSQNYPNPFNPKTVVRSQLPVASEVKLAVYDLLGREIAVLVNERRSPGNYQDTFDGTGLASGVYLYRLTAGDFVQTRPMILTSSRSDGLCHGIQKAVGVTLVVSRPAQRRCGLPVCTNCAPTKTGRSSRELGPRMGKFLAIGFEERANVLPPQASLRPARPSEVGTVTCGGNLLASQVGY